MTVDNAAQQQSMAARGWDDFWRNEGSTGGGCLPSADAEIDRAQAALWQAFAKRLPRRAKTLDIATGDGRVMRHMLSSRPDIRPVGVDLAETLPQPPKGCKVRAGVAMEKLPFADGIFAGVTSQFGLEYGDIDAALAEIARVLAGEGQLALILHDADGPILKHNIARRDALEWVVEDQNLIDKAKASLSLRSVGIVVAPAVAHILDEATARYGHGSAAWEISAAVVETLRGGAGFPIGHVSDTLAILAAKARNEIWRIEALERASEAIADVGQVIARAEQAGFVVSACEHVLTKHGSTPFAHHLLAQRA